MLICMVNNAEIIKNHIVSTYKQVLKREPDETGLSYFIKEIQENRIQQKELESILKNSEEYQVLIHSRLPLKITGTEKAKDVTMDSNLISQENMKNLEILRDYLYNLQIVPGPKEELHGYVNEAFFRFVKTLQMISYDSTGKLLEIGSNPYFITTLLSKFRKFDLSGANFFSTENKSITQSVVNEKFGEKFLFSSKLFNIEEEIFPYEDSTFDTLIFCEVLEHQTKDPIHIFHEIHRVLKPNGILILTTPNVARQSNIDHLKNNENIYDPYSNYGIYGRHNREYTVNELKDLLPNLGFEISSIFTKFVHFKQPDKNWWDLSEHDNSKGDYIFIKARKNKKFTDYRPNWLFR
jgi:SAM-dependent methyltransferase